jgi:hypothetical protein
MEPKRAGVIAVRHGSKGMSKVQTHTALCEDRPLVGVEGPTARVRDGQQLCGAVQVVQDVHMHFSTAKTRASDRWIGNGWTTWPTWTTLDQALCTYV